MELIDDGNRSSRERRAQVLLAAGWMCVACSSSFGWYWSSLFLKQGINYSLENIPSLISLMFAVLLVCVSTGLGFLVIRLDFFRNGIALAIFGFIIPIFSFLWPFVLELIEALR